MIDLIKNIEDNDCKGLIYRCKVNHFKNSKGHVIFSSRFIPMKKLSCPGCHKCGALIESLDECIANDTLPITTTEKNNQLYSLEMSDISYDWETGYIDDWDLEFKEFG